MRKGPIIPWMGGKSKMAAKIISILPKHTCYCEPFAGGAAVLFHKDQSKVEVINDINGELINLYRVVQNHLDEFVRQFRWALTSRTIYKWEQKKNIETLTDIQRAARFFYLQKLAFGGKVTGQTFGTGTSRPPAFNLLRIEEDLSQAHIRLARVLVECLPWDECIAKYDRTYTVFFCDPPYYKTAGYGVEFEFDNYLKLAAIMKSAAGKFILTINDCPEMRDVFRHFKIEEYSLQYSNHNLRTGKRKTSKELIITNA